VTAERGLADLTRSVFASLGLGIDNPLDIAPTRGSDVVMLIDGFGTFIFDEYATAIPVISQESESYLASLRSYFPTTTVTNLTSLGTGQLPAVHGMVGYTMRIPFASEGTPQLLNGLKWDPRIDPLTWQREVTLFEQAMRVGIDVFHIASKRYEGSGFTEAALRGARYLPAQSDDEIIAALAESTRRGPSFSYLYLNDVDEAGHSHGVGSSKWLGALQRVDELVKKIISTLPRGSRLWITADHGMVNAGEKVVLGLDNPLLEDVVLLGGEPRARHLYLTGSGSAQISGDQLEVRINDVRERWRDFFGERIALLQPTEAYGDSIEPGIKARIGDIIAIPTDDTVLIEQERQEMQSRMVGHHGAMTRIESAIPLRCFAI
jgi:hypothetical protein